MIYILCKYIIYNALHLLQCNGVQSTRTHTFLVLALLVTKQKILCCHFSDMGMPPP